VKLRAYQPGDEEAHARIFNELASTWPGFEPLTAANILRSTRKRGFSPQSRLSVEVAGQVVAYITTRTDGRVTAPWCQPGHESAATPLIQAALDQLRQANLPRAYFVTRHDWPQTIALMEAHGFVKVRDVYNYSLALTDTPTLTIRSRSEFATLTARDIPTLRAMAPTLFTIDEQTLSKHLLENPQLASEAVYASRSRGTGELRGVGLVVIDPNLGQAKVDANAPIFRFGAFGNEAYQTERLNGLFSFVCSGDPMSIGLDLLGEALRQVEELDIDYLHAQVPSDQPQLLHFYDRVFRRRGSFPLYELPL
jgi:hypothetical protein